MTTTGHAVGHSPAQTAAYIAAGQWGTTSLADHVRRWAHERPTALALADSHDRVSWADYDRESTRLAAHLLAAGLRRGDRLAVLLPDSAAVHIAWLGAEKAGLVVVGVGPRAGEREMQHLVGTTEARAVLSGPTIGERGSEEVLGSLRASGLSLTHLLIDSPPQRPWRVSQDGAELSPLAEEEAARLIDERRIGPSELFMLNSTSGTTGLPKCVMHTQNRWMYFHQLAVEAGELSAADVFCSAIPSPFGFGLWTAHITPAVLGAPTHLIERFSPQRLLDVLAQEGITVLSAVSTQFIMLMNSPAAAAERGRLRVLFTGGEAVPFERAAEFEQRTGARVLQFYGSNETGALSRTAVTDDQDHRLRTAGRVIPEMQVRVIDPDTNQVLGAAGRGQAICRGPATCEGYYADPAANDLLYTDDGWMLTGDLVEIDDDGYLSVVGRISDIIIRGGKNISAPAVEAEVATHPAVALAAAVSMPDPVFGERVCIYVQLRTGQRISLAQITDHLAARGVTREWFPERLVVLDRLPSASGGKVAKAALRDDIRRRLAAEAKADVQQHEGSGRDQRKREMG